jgi:antitoxin component of RelBE/YafQ-DinJ toxin-antitoxin module
MAVPKYKLTGLKWGTVSITPPTVSAQNVSTGTVEVVGLEPSDKIFIMLQGEAQKEAIPVAAQCRADNVLTIQFANITSGTAAATAKSMLWLATKE